MRQRKPRNAALEFAKAFTYLVAQEACRLGKRRTLDATKFEKWIRGVIRVKSGDLDQIGEAIGKRLHWLVYDQRIKWQRDIDFCVKRGRAFAHRHKVLVAEQVLTNEVRTLSLEEMKYVKQTFLNEELAEHLLAEFQPGGILRMFGKRVSRREARKA